jgi:hypothetical protein
MRGACTGARSKPSSPADQLALACSAGRDAAANLARFGAHDPKQIPVFRLYGPSRAVLQPNVGSWQTEPLIRRRVGLASVPRRVIRDVAARPER